MLNGDSNNFYNIFRHIENNIKLLVYHIQVT